MNLTLQTPIERLNMIGPTYAQRLKKLEILTIKDLLHHYPSRYEDLSFISPIDRLQPGKLTTIQGEVISCQNIFTKGGKKIQKAIIADTTGQIEATWFNQTFLPQTLKPGVKVSLAGKPDYFGYRLTLTSPEYEIIKTNNLQPTTYNLNLVHTGRLVPIYPETYGVSSKWLRSRIWPLLNQFTSLSPDWLPQEIIKIENFISLATALKQIHFPDNLQVLDQAQKRLAFNELFLIQLAAQKRKFLWQQKHLSHALSVNQEKVLDFISRLPFELTLAQRKAIKQILTDLTRHQPMNRLLQGDVGSGKTVVAAIAMYISYLNNLPSILMAPTEILAQQHYQTISALFKPYRLNPVLVTSSTKSKIKSKIANSPILIGTHALLFNKLPPNLGVLIIDEQHRFGVKQRAQLLNQSKTPHLLSMTATPIPRTIALTLYAELDLSLLDELPTGRKSVKTKVVPASKRNQAYAWVKNRIQSRHTQAFIVCPLIEISGIESLSQVKAAQQEFKYLKSEIFPDLKLELLHGRMKVKDKSTAIDHFKTKKAQILVSTPVIEVGIDIPNATIMLIEGAERFGLAQLHQLRGRVGRGDQQSFCLLFPTAENQTTLKRLQAMETETSGFKLAELDLKLRGPGEIYGLRQHGFAQLKLASFTDRHLISLTNQYAQQLITSDPHLNHHLKLQHQLNALLEKPVAPN